MVVCALLDAAGFGPGLDLADAKIAFELALGTGDAKNRAYGGFAVAEEFHDAVPLAEVSLNLNLICPEICKLGGHCRVAAGEFLDRKILGFVIGQPEIVF
jgi:hypothetical protein